MFIRESIPLSGLRLDFSDSKPDLPHSAKFGFQSGFACPQFVPKGNILNKWCCTDLITNQYRNIV